MGYGFWADLIVALHVAYVSYIVLGLLAILIGAARGWEAKTRFAGQRAMP
jgi:hypothetical protein